MNKQEEIREEIRGILRKYGDFMGGYDAEGDGFDMDETLGAILSYLHSQGVVIYKRLADADKPYNSFESLIKG